MGHGGFERKTGIIVKNFFKQNTFIIPLFVGTFKTDYVKFMEILANTKEKLINVCNVIDDSQKK